MYDKKIPIRHNREETIEIIVFIGPINFQMNIHIFAKKNDNVLYNYNFYLQESRVSTVWCEGQVLSMNGTFNAYLLKERPKLKRWKHGQHVTMNR